MTPEVLGLDYEDVTLTTSDGLNLHGWYLPVSTPRATLLFCHGNGGNIGDRLESLRIFHQLGVSILIFDYRGYGKSDGKPTPEGTALDAEAAWNWLLEEKNVLPNDIIVFGRSLGGAVALELMRHKKPRVAILESTFASPFGVLRIDFLVPFLRLVIGDVWNSKEAAQSLRTPVLCLHSPDDDIVPYREGVRLYEALAGEKEFIELQGDHNTGFLYSMPSYKLALEAFLTRHFGMWPR
ncbi:MAG: alpha/beta hydrolase [Fretibacterium sp.]|nr:alpha/beta hydrolase [Fretibacterium sp.]